MTNPVVTDDGLLPCDVKLPPATTIRAGCKLNTLVEALCARGMARPAASDRDVLVGRIADLELVTDLALQWLIKQEPGDSRAVSNEFVAMAAIRCEQDNLEECRKIIRAALLPLAGEV